VYGGVARRDGKYQVMVPRGYTYDLYAYYSYVSYTSTADTKGTVVNYYKKLSGISPGTANQDFSGAWTQY
jgi:hypothetical protein